MHNKIQISLGDAKETFKQPGEKFANVIQNGSTGDVIYEPKTLTLRHHIHKSKSIM